MKITFGLYGSGWRSEFFLRISKLLPEKFCVDGVITTNSEKSKIFKEASGVKIYPNLTEYLKNNNPLFIVESVNKSVSSEITMDILKKGIPVLMETPAGANLETMLKMYNEMPNTAKLQIAEQYPFHPLHMARLNLIESGKLGNIQHVQVSFSHGYHGIALIRKFLGIGFENAKITATNFSVSGLSGVSRLGEPKEEEILTENQTIAILNFGNKTALYNFETGQHRSWIRTPIIQIKGERGEIFNETFKYLPNFKTPIEMELKRINLGENQNVEGFGLKGITVGERWCYKNSYPNSRLSDDEIAVAMCLEKIANYIINGEQFYSFSEAAQDMYLSLMIDKALEQNIQVMTEIMPWAKKENNRDKSYTF